MMNKNNIKFDLTVRLALVFFAMISILVYFHVRLHQSVEQKEYDSVVFNFAGYQRANIQSYTRETNLVLVALAASDWPNLLLRKQNAQESLRDFETKHRILTYGGAAVFNGVLTKLPAQTSPEIIKQMDRVWKEWKELLRVTNLSLRSNPSELRGNALIDRIQSQSALATLAMNNAITLIQRLSATKHRKIVDDQILSIASTIILGILSGFFVYFRIIQPLAKNITELDCLGKNIEKQRQWLQVTLASIGDAVLTTDQKGHITFLNSIAEKLTGWNLNEASGKPGMEIFQIVNEGTREVVFSPINEVLQTNRITWLANHTVLISKDGTETPIDDSAAPILDESGNLIGMVLVFRDISERVKAEKDKQNIQNQLIHSQKLEAIGQLAAGIAHEINTPIQYIGNNVQFLACSFADLRTYIERMEMLISDFDHVHTQTMSKNDVMNDSAANSSHDTSNAGESNPSSGLREELDVDYIFAEIPKAIDQSLLGIERTSEIIKAMKNFSHPESKQQMEIDLNEAIKSTVIVARNEWKDVSEVIFELDDQLPQIRCYPGELNQVILNLVVNAAHAVGDIANERKEKGKITIRTKLQNDQVEIQIQDTGAGISETIRDRIFTPFFTTKEVGKGTGQGLHLSYKIITENHAGTITFESRLRIGTTFLIHLPVKGNQEMRNGV